MAASLSISEENIYMVASSTPPVAVFFGGRLRFGGPERRRYLTVANNKNGRGLDPGVIIIPAQDNLTIINNIMSLFDELNKRIYIFSGLA